MSKHTPGALRAAKRAWGYHHGSIESLADLIDRETGLPELLEAAVAAYDCLVGVFGPVGCESFEEERWDDQDACETAFKLHAAIAKAREG